MNIEDLDLDLYSQNFNFGKMVGQLETIAHFNGKTNHHYIFDLGRYHKKENIKLSIETSLKFFCHDYNLTRIVNPKEYLLEILRDNWFYSYQDTREYHLIDKGNNFSFYHLDWKTEYVQEFIKLLFESLNPTEVYKVDMVQQIGYYANTWENIAFETPQHDLWDYMLELRHHD